MDNLDKIVLSLKDLVIEFKGETPEFIANEISNRLGNWNASDRETEIEKQSGVRNNFWEILAVLNCKFY
jgi:hypothetical protein